MTTPRKLSSRYELGEILGFGGMSEVHLARDLRLNRDVAIKVLRADLARDPTFYLRFKREAQNAAALNHPAIVAVYDTGEAEIDGGPLPYIVMEYVDGETLRDLVRGKGPLPPRRAMEILADVCAALDFSHKNGIVHRDMKPANIMINRAGAVKVMDFGIARSISDASSPMTQTSAVIGTAQYLSPEQARGEQVDARSDVYSVGCVLFEILTGEPPFTGDSPVSVAYQHVREDPRLPSQVHDGVPRELDSIILKAMSKNPANRYQSAAEMRSDLVRVLGGQKPGAPTVMSDDDRTSMLGGTDSTPHRHRAGGGRGDGDHGSAAGGMANRTKILGLSAAAIVVILIIGAFAWVVSPLGRPDQVAVPDVTGMSEPEAKSVLEKAGFEVAEQKKPSSTTATGKAIGTRPARDSKAQKNSTVNLEISKGPELVSVPKVIGMSEANARLELERQGLQMSPVLKAASSAAEKDTVTKTEPAAGNSVNPETVVQVTIGTGPKNAAVPTVAGQSFEAAKAALEAAGFTVGAPQDTSSSQPKGTAIKTDPPGGTTADKTKPITVYVSDGAQISMPSLAGQTVAEAVQSLQQVGWTGSQSDIAVTYEPSVIQTAGTISKQDPKAGSPIGKNDPVNVTVYRLGLN